MSDRRLRTLLLVLCVVGVAVARALGVGRAKPAPDVSRHPSVDDGHRPSVPAPAPPPEVAPPARARVFEQPVDTVATLPGPTPPVDPAEPLDLAAPLDLAGPQDLAGRTDPIEVAWRAPIEGACPDGYPVKAKLRSGIFHLPGMAAYDRTAPDRCYPSAEAAVADGLRPAKR